ncbi:hypothetical protein [Rhodococcus sp. OK302]|uniref:hypothetical protein n=1 Tax=Rhodococcus sp. OK302 TaxID=1882769 RepID=UPI000B93E56B|nr:hypothetical protein [Rhodococcus sp. OK302]OYD67004.1 hypothetical protein BDB13_0505 [Rhodococcus sp. OK302]
MTVTSDEQSPLTSAQVTSARRAIHLWQRAEHQNIELHSDTNFDEYLADHPELHDSIRAAHTLQLSFRHRQLQVPMFVLIAAHFQLSRTDRAHADKVYTRFDEQVGFRSADATSEFGLYVKITRFAGLDPEVLGDSRSGDADLPTDGIWGPVLQVQPLADGIAGVEARRRLGLLVSLRRIVEMPKSLCPEGIVDGEWVWLNDRSADLVRLVHADELGIADGQFDELELTVARRLPLAWARWKSGTGTRTVEVPCNITFSVQQRLTAAIAWLPRGSGRAEGTDWLVEQGLDREELRDQVWVNPASQAYSTERSKWTEYAIDRISKHAAQLHSEQDQAKDTLISRLVLEGWTRHALHLGASQEQVDTAARDGRTRANDRLTLTRTESQLESEGSNDD